MVFSVVWLDSEQAKIFYISEDKMQREIVKASHVEHHTHRIENDDRIPYKMFDEVANKLHSAKKILILGPGAEKNHFLTRLHDKHFVVAKKVVGCESAGHPHDHQIAAYATKFFHNSTKLAGNSC